MPSIRTISVSGSIPSITQLALGDLAINTYDGKAYIKKQQGTTQTVLEVGTGAGGGGGVTQIIAGTNITISPVGGTGAVTINASSTTVSASYAATASSADSFLVRNQLTASGLNYPSVDNGEFSFIQTDGNGNLSLQYVNTLYETVYNGEATSLTKGTPVYVSGSVGANSIVYRADAGNPSKMPVIYIIADNINSGNTGRAIVLGLITGVSTTGYPAGTEVFVAVGGGWTATRPTGSAIVQVLGIITKEGSGGQGVVLNPGPANLPNLPSGSVWVGNSGSFPTAVLTSSLSVNSALTASYVLPLTQSVSIKGTGTTSATTALLVQNSNASSSLQIKDDRSTLFAGSNGNPNDNQSGTFIDGNGTVNVRRSINGVTYGLRVHNGAGWGGHDAILGLSYRYPIYGAQGGNGSEQASPLGAGAGVLGKGGVGVLGQGVTPTGDSGSIGVMATTLFVNPTLTTSQYNRLAAAQIKGIGTSNSGSALTVRNGSDLPIITALDNRFVGIGTFSPSASLDVVGNVNISSSAGTSPALQVYKSGSTVVSIQGSQGELFSITDSLSGSLFSVSNISGLPILEVFSDNTVTAGSYINPGLTVTGSRVIATGSFSGSFTGSFSGTSSYSNNALSASYAVSSSYASTANYAASTPVVPSTLFVQGYLLANQSIPNGADTLINFERQFDTNLWLDPGTRRFTPTVAGYYSVSFGAWLENPASATDQFNVQIRKSTGGGPTTTVMILQQPLNNGTGITLTGTRIFYMDGALDYLDFTAYQGSGAPRNLLYGGTSDGAGTWFSAHLLTM